MSASATIYALSDPRQPALIRYIGKTEALLSHRLACHVCEAKKARSARAFWIRELSTDLVRPLIWPLEHVSVAEWEDRERFWIAQFWTLPGFLNRTVGGDAGFKGGRHSEATKARYSAMRKGLKPSPLNVQRTIERNKRGLSAETRAKISKALTGRPTGRKASPAFIAATIARNKRGLPPEALSKMAAKLRGRKLSAEHVRKVKESVGWKSAQAAFVLANEKRKRPIVCVETGEEFTCMGAAAVHAGVSKTHMFSHIKAGWRVRGKRYRRKEKV